MSVFVNFAEKNIIFSGFITFDHLVLSGVQKLTYASKFDTLK